MAPEVVAINPSYDTRADIWSLGITIYEMTKGAPPHYNVMALQAMEVISKAAPPRLAEADGTKDMRDFVALCLREVASERPSADELIKTKWLKSAAKASVAPLKDLVVRYENFISEQGPRASLAGPLPWEEEEERDRLDADAALDRHSWQFETIRGRMHPSFFNGDRGVDDELDQLDASFNHATIRAPGSSTLPTSLRGLFGEEESSSDNFIIPGFQSKNHSASPIPAVVTPDEQPKEPFAFPPGGMSRARSKLSTSSALPSDSEHEEPLPPLGPGIPRKEPLDSGSESSSATIRNQTYRDVRTSRGLPNIEIPPLPSHKPNQSLDVSNGHPFSEDKSSPETPASARATVNRKRSQTSSEGIRPSIKRSASAAAEPFQFPPAPAHKLGPSLRVQDRISPTQNTVPALSPSHQSAYSLDTPGISRKPDLLRSPMPSIARTRSATALVDAISGPGTSPPVPPPPNRQTTRDTSPLMAPIKPFARRDRSGSSGSDGNASSSSLGVPTLKEVLKVPSLSTEHQIGMTDLLPPSPSAVHYVARNFVPSPSALSSAIGPSENLSSFKEAVNASAVNTSASFSLGFPRSHSPTPLEPLFNGPVLRPLDYSDLMGSDENTHAELSKTVDDLTRWLSVVELGLTGMLDPLGTDTIEEEEEGLSTFATEDDSEDFPYLQTKLRAR